MKLPNFRDRHLVNVTIASAVLFHLVSLIMAARFQWSWLTQLAFRSGLALYFLLGPIFWLWHRTTLPANKRGSLDSIVDTMQQARQLKPYDPTSYFDLEHGLFAGLDIDDGLKPIYAPWEQMRSTHMQVLGPTGFGKGVATTIMLAQCAAVGECVVIFDPKFPGDKYASRVLNNFAAERRILFYLLNLSPRVPTEWKTNLKVTPPQLNLFRGCTDSELNELLSTAFNLADTGGPDSHYRLHDRVACQDVCERAASANPGQVNIRDLVSAAHKSPLTIDEKGKPIDFRVKLQEIAKLPVLQTPTGLDLSAILEQNAILYIVGNIRDPQTVAVQKMLLLRLIQIIEQRNRNLENRPVAMMLDELKYMLSAGVLQGLGAARDKGCHIMLAHQTNGDLEECGGLPPAAVLGAVKKNTTKKLIYQVTEEDAEWASGLSGTIVVAQKSAHMQQGMFHAGEGQFREIERPFLTENQLKSMPQMTGMLYGFGLAKRVQVSPMPYGDWPRITITPEILPGPEAQNHSSSATPETEQGAQVAPQLPAANPAPDANQNDLSSPDPFRGV